MGIYLYQLGCCHRLATLFSASFEFLGHAPWDVLIPCVDEPFCNRKIWPFKVVQPNAINLPGLGMVIFYDFGLIPHYPLVNIQKLLNMAIEIVDLPIKNGDFP